MSNTTWRGSAMDLHHSVQVRKWFSGLNNDVHLCPWYNFQKKNVASKLKVQPMPMCRRSPYRKLPQFEVNRFHPFKSFNINRISVFSSLMLSWLVLTFIKPGTCREGWSSYQRSCYLLSTTTVTWSKAEELCKSHGGHLVVFNNVEELVRFKGHIFCSFSVSTRTCFHASCLNILVLTLCLLCMVGTS